MNDSMLNECALTDATQKRLEVLIKIHLNKFYELQSVTFEQKYERDMDEVGIITIKGIVLDN